MNITEENSSYNSYMANEHHRSSSLKGTNLKSNLMRAITYLQLNDIV